MTLILMGDWCSEDITDTLTFEISAEVKTLKTKGQFYQAQTLQEKILFLATGLVFSLDRCLLMGDPFIIPIFVRILLKHYINSGKLINSPSSSYSSETEKDTFGK